MSEVARKIAAEIQNRGPISFARFMELALYCPVYGYYEKEGDTIGRRGDYFTSASVGPVFGELLAFQFAEWLGQCRAQPFTPAKPQPAGGTQEHPGTFGDASPPELYLVEAGAHRAELARDILGWLRQHRPSLFMAVQYLDRGALPAPAAVAARNPFRIQQPGPLGGRFARTRQRAAFRGARRHLFQRTSRCFSRSPAGLGCDRARLVRMGCRLLRRPVCLDQDGAGRVCGPGVGTGGSCRRGYGRAFAGFAGRVLR